MNQKEFILEVQKLCHQDGQHCTALQNALCRMMAQAGVEQVPVTLPGLGTFSSHKHPEYMQEDPQTGLMTLYPPRITYRMQPEDPAVSGEVLITQLAEHTQTTRVEAESFAHALAEVIVTTLNHGEEVEVKNLGTFRNVITHQGELQRIAYTPDEAMRQLVNAPFSCFEPMSIGEGQERSFAAQATAVEPEAPVVEDAIEAPAVTPVVDDMVPDIVVDTMADTVEAAPEEPDVAGQDQTAVSTTADVVAEVDAPTEVSEPVAAPVDAAPVDAAPISPENTTPIPPKDETTPISPKMSKNDNYDYGNGGLDGRNNSMLYVMVTLILLVCGALIWFIYTVDSEDAEFHRPHPASTVEVDDPAPAMQPDAQAALHADTLAQADTLALVPDASDAQPAIEAEAAPVAPEAQVPAPAAAPDQAPAVQPAVQDDGQHLLLNPDGTPKLHKLVSGDRLTTLALKYYGEKNFWPYIYEVNQPKLKNPSLIQVGMELKLPDPAYFGLDPNNAEAVQRAKVKAAQYLK